jgi:hypothetical protein
VIHGERPVNPVVARREVCVLPGAVGSVYSRPAACPCEPETSYPRPAGVVSGARWYSPNVGRWTIRDPLGEGDTPDVYQFLRNDAIRHTDRLGLSTDDHGAKDADCEPCCCLCPDYIMTDEFRLPPLAMGHDVTVHVRMSCVPATVKTHTSAKLFWWELWRGGDRFEKDYSVAWPDFKEQHYSNPMSASWDNWKNYVGACPNCNGEVNLHDTPSVGWVYRPFIRTIWFKVLARANPGCTSTCRKAIGHAEAEMKMEQRLVEYDYGPDWKISHYWLYWADDPPKPEPFPSYW